jgi:hypothetical protein
VRGAALASNAAQNAARTRIESSAHPFPVFMVLLRMESISSTKIEAKTGHARDGFAPLALTLSLPQAETGKASGSTPRRD